MPRDFGAHTTADEVLAGRDLSAQVALVTGASGGLGAETARALAAKGADVTLTARDRGKADAVAQAIRDSTGNERVRVLELELTDFESVRGCAKAFLAEHGALHMLINNAGVMACPLARTPQGYELHFAANHLGHFLLTGLLVPALRAASPARVVSVSSAGHGFSGIVFDDIHYEHRPYDKWGAYGQSKTANVLFALELDRRLRDAGVRSFSLHPGAIVTDLGRHLEKADIEVMMSRTPSGGFEYKSAEAGAATSVFAATAPELDGRGGLYLADCRVSAQKTSPTDLEGYSPHALDPAAAARLWDVSEQLVGERFDF